MMLHNYLYSCNYVSLRCQIWHTTTREGTEGTEGTVEGGKVVLWIPILYGLGAVAMGVDLGFRARDMKNSIDLYNHTTELERRRNEDKQRFYDDYKKNTGVTALYEYYSGAYVDYVGSALTANQGIIDLYYKGKRLLR